MEWFYRLYSEMQKKYLQLNIINFYLIFNTKLNLLSWFNDIVVSYC